MDTLNAGRYRLHREVGRGPGGSVYLAHDPLLDCRVAVKVGHAFLASDRAFVTRFWEQALVLARMDHPHWVRLLDVVECQGRPALVSEYVAGASLSDVLRHRRQRLSTEQALGVVRDVLSLLEHLHEHGIVHGNLKPGNVLCTSDGTVKVCDAALWAPIGAISDGAGQPACDASPSVGGDLHSCGVILNELLSGRRPDGASLSAPRSLPVAALPDQRRGAPHTAPVIEALAVSALALCPEDRIRTAAEMRERLDEAAAEGCGRGWRRRRSMVTAVGVAIAAGAPSAAACRAILGGAGTAGGAASLPDLVGGMTTGGSFVPSPPSPPPSVSATASAPPPVSVPAQPVTAPPSATESVATPAGSPSAHATGSAGLSPGSSGSGTPRPMAQQVLPASGPPPRDVPFASPPRPHTARGHDAHDDGGHLRRRRRPRLRRRLGPNALRAVHGLGLLTAVGATAGFLVISVPRLRDAAPSPSTSRSPSPAPDRPTPKESAVTGTATVPPLPVEPVDTGDGHGRSGDVTPAGTRPRPVGSGALASAATGRVAESAAHSAQTAMPRDSKPSRASSPPSEAG